MTFFLLGLFVFFAPHLATAFARRWRENAIKKYGVRRYKGVYSLVSALGFIMLVYGWRFADATLLYAPPSYMRYATQAFMLIALISLAAAYLPKGKIAGALKHPMLAAVKLWAFGHLLANGEARSVILFGAFLAYAVIDRVAAKKRGDPGASAGSARNDVLVVAVGVALWAAIYFVLHPYIAGVSLR
jgi:uncharacterized membrane protein